MTQQSLHVATSILSKTINRHVVNIHCQLDVFFKAVFTTERNYDEQTTSSKQNGANVNASWFQVRFFCCQPNLDVCNDRKIY